MRTDEMEFFIGVVREIKVKDYYNDTTTPLTVCHALGMGENRANYLLRKWYKKGFWEYNPPRNIFTGYFIEENFEGGYKKIYEDIRELKYNLIYNNIKSIETHLSFMRIMFALYSEETLGYNVVLVSKIRKKILEYRLSELIKQEKQI